MAKVITPYGRKIDFDAAEALMDKDICKEIEAEGYETEQAYFDAYCEMHMLVYREEFGPAKKKPVW